MRNNDGSLQNFSATHKELNNADTEDQYLNYLVYANHLAINFTDNILKTDPNSIIILASDHGYRKAVSSNKQFNPFNNLLAIYTPNQNYKGFTGSTSLVNVFRIILNNYFNQQLPLLNNQTFHIN